MEIRTRPGRKLERTLRRVLDQYDELLAVPRDAGPFPETRTKVSRWTALDHAEHMSKADAASLHQLEAALERDGGPPPKLLGRLILRLGWIPRGTGKAPGTTRPEEPSADAEADAGERRDAVIERLLDDRSRVEALASRLDEIAAAPGRSTHPVFGGLTPARWVRFLWVHHHHHLKIIREIRQAIDRSARRPHSSLGGQRNDR
jgi:hypothetical protein